MVLEMVLVVAGLQVQYGNSVAVVASTVHSRGHRRISSVRSMEPGHSPAGCPLGLRQTRRHAPLEGVAGVRRRRRRAVLPTPPPMLSAAVLSDSQEHQLEELGEAGGCRRSQRTAPGPRAPWALRAPLLGAGEARLPRVRSPLFPPSGPRTPFERRRLRCAVAQAVPEREPAGGERDVLGAAGEVREPLVSPRRRAQRHAAVSHCGHALAPTHSWEFRRVCTMTSAAPSDVSPLPQVWVLPQASVLSQVVSADRLFRPDHRFPPAFSPRSRLLWCRGFSQTRLFAGIPVGARARGGRGERGGRGGVGSGGAEGEYRPLAPLRAAISAAQSALRRPACRRLPLTACTCPLTSASAFLISGRSIWRSRASAGGAPAAPSACTRGRMG